MLMRMFATVLTVLSLLQCQCRRERMVYKIDPTTFSRVTVENSVDAYSADYAFLPDGRPVTPMIVYPTRLGKERMKPRIGFRLQKERWLVQCEGREYLFDGTPMVLCQNGCRVIAENWNNGASPKAPALELSKFVAETLSDAFEKSSAGNL